MRFNLLVSCVVLAVIALGCEHSSETVKSVRVFCCNKTGEIRAFPSSRAPIIGKLEFNESKTVLDSTRVGGVNWYLVELADSSGWIHGSAVESSYVEPDFRRDLEKLDGNWSLSRYGTHATWRVSIKNKSAVYCYKDIVFTTAYSGESGTVLDIDLLGHTEYVIMKPGQIRTLEWEDYDVPSQSRTATTGIARAEYVVCPD